MELKKNILFCIALIFFSQSNALNIEILSSYSNFVQAYIPCIFDYADILYFQVESSLWFQMEADFTNLEQINKAFTQACNSASSINSENNLVCIEKDNSKISIFDPSNNFALVTQVPLNNEYKNWEVLFIEDFLILNNEVKNGEDYVIVNALNGKELYIVPKLYAVQIWPGNDAFYFVTGVSNTQFVTYFPQNKSQVVALTLPAKMNVMFLEAMNETSVFMACTSKTVAALVGINMNKGIAGIPTVVQQMNFNSKLNDTHMIVQHGVGGNYVSLYYVSQNLSVVEALRLDLSSHVPDGTELEVQNIEGTSAILIIASNQEKTQGIYSLIVNATNMEMIEYQFGTGDFYPAEIELQNGSYVYLTSLLNGYFIGDGINFPIFIKNGQGGYYTSPMQPNSVWTFIINPTKSTGECTLTNFEPSGISFYQYEECPCSVGQNQELFITSLVGTPNQDDFMFSYVCGGIYVYNQEKFIGSFNPIDLDWSVLPLTLVNKTSINIVNVELKNGVQLYSYNFNSSEPQIQYISPPVKEPSFYGSKISEDIVLYSYPQGSKTIISAYQISLGRTVQNINVDIGSPFGVYPFQVNEESSQPIEVAVLIYEVGPKFHAAAVTAQGEIADLENGEFIQMLSRNTIVMNNNQEYFMDLVVYEVVTNQRSDKFEKSQFFQQLNSHSILG